MRKQRRPLSAKQRPTQSVDERAVNEIRQAITERRFAPWHAADLLESAETPAERTQAIKLITDLVGRGGIA